MQADNDVFNCCDPAFFDLFFPIFVQFSFLPYFEDEFFVKDFSTIMQARTNAHICMLVDDDLLYCGIENQLSPAYSFLPYFEG